MSRSEDVGAKQETVGELQVQLGAALRRERIQQRLDQQALAGHAGVTRAAISRIENGHGGTVATMLAIVRALGRQDWLASLAPQVTVSPMDLISRSRQMPTRVRQSKDSI
jgi:transcriptional regulator with XRE-family HTH domain